MPNIIPKKTVHFEESENGFINQLQGENYWAVRNDGRDAYFDTLEEARRYMEMPLEKDIEIKFFKGYRWKWKTDPPDKWHDTCLIQFVIKKTNVVISAAKLGCLYCKGSPEDTKNSVFKELSYDYGFQRQRDSSYGSSVLVKSLEVGEEIEIPTLCYCKDSTTKDGSPWAWDEARTPHENLCCEGFKLKVEAKHIDPIANDPKDLADDDQDDEDWEEDMKIRKEFDEWRAKTTEFSKEEFFGKVREVASAYEIKEVESKDENALRFEGKTVELHTYDYSEGIGDKAKKIYYRCRYVLKAVYDPFMCHIDASIDGSHETHMGSGSPIKTREDLERIGGDCIYANYLEKKPKRPEPTEPVVHYQQMSLFDFV